MASGASWGDGGLYTARSDPGGEAGAVVEICEVSEKMEEITKNQREDSPHNGKNEHDDQGESDFVISHD